MSKTAKIIIVVLVAVAIIGLAYWAYTKYKKPAVASGDSTLQVSRISSAPATVAVETLSKAAA